MFDHATIDAAANGLLEAIRSSARSAMPDAGEPPDAVVGNIAIQALTQRLEYGTMMEAFLRAAVSSSMAHGFRKRDVREALLRAFDQTWRGFADELQRAKEAVN